jgi:hypothetical protein
VAAGVTTVVLGSLAVAVAPGGAGAEEEFINGSGKADAQILRIGPSAGRLSMAPTIGLTLADFVGSLGRGESRTGDFAALDGSVPAEVKNQLPIVRAESTDDDAGTPHTAGFAATPSSSPIKVGGSDQSATATKDPRGTSSYTLGAYGVPGIFEVGSSTANSTAGVVGGKTREANGVSRISSITIAGGLVTLKGLTWEATQRTGAGAATTANFRVDGVTIGGGTSGPLNLPVPPQNLTPPNGDLGAVLGPINTALKPTGFALVPPTTSTDGNIARVSPLTLQVADSEVGRTALAPILAALQPIRDPITGALINADARFSSAVLLADVAVGVFSGSGRADIQFGGASAFTEGEKYVSPFGSFSFGSFTLPDSSDSAFSSSDTGSALSSDTSAFDTSSSLGSSSSSASLGSGATAAPAAVGTPKPTTGAARTAVPASANRTIPGKRGGVAALIGLAGLLAALGMASMDYRRIRSNRRTIVVS